MNVKKTLLAIVVVTVLWWFMDFLIHGVLLMPTYQATASLWRPMEQMNMGLGIVCTLVFATLYVLFYSYVVHPKTFHTGIKFGMWYGLIGGWAMAGSYIHLPISEGLAACWFAAVFVESLVAGALMGLITKD